MNTMTLKEFQPQGSTGGEVSDMFYHSSITGPQGATYYLLKEAHHTPEDISRAKSKIRNSFDAVAITIIKEKIE